MSPCLCQLLICLVGLMPLMASLLPRSHTPLCFTARQGRTTDCHIIPSTSLASHAKAAGPGWVHVAIGCLCRWLPRILLLLLQLLLVAISVCALCCFDSCLWVCICG